MPINDVKYTRLQLDGLLKDVYEGGINPASLPEDLYRSILHVLSDGVVRGFGKVKLNDEIEDLLAHFDHNVAVFSAAKTHQQVVDMTRKMFDPSTGMKRSFSAFKRDAGEIFEEYNVNWLRTEYRTAFSNAAGARQWYDFKQNADFAPMLRYDTSGDERVRDEHADLDGIVRHLDDPFWRRWFPPNGWNCRCDVTQHEIGEVESSEGAAISGFDPPDELFDFNPYIDKVVFDENHPYTSRVAERYHVLRAKNFNLPVPPKPRTRKTELRVEAKPKGLENKPDGFDAFTGVKMPSDFWSMFKKRVPIKKTSPDDAFHRLGEVFIGVGRRYPLGSQEMRGVVAHEYGHAFHYQHQILIRNKPREETFERFFAKHRKETFAYGKRGEKLTESGERLEMFKKNPTFEGRARLKEIAGEIDQAHGLDHKKGIGSELLGNVFDIVGSFTMGSYGGGHKVSYYRDFDGYGGRAEVFAHMFDLGVNKNNPYLKYFFPTLHDELIELYEDYKKRYSQ